jgi:hypothetical protein
LSAGVSGSASLALGRNAAYLHQLIFRGTPKVPPEDLREALTRYLEINESELRHRKVPPRKARSKHSTNDNHVGVVPRTSSVPEGSVGIAEEVNVVGRVVWAARRL